MGRELKWTRNVLCRRAAAGCSKEGGINVLGGGFQTEKTSPLRQAQEAQAARSGSKIRRKARRSTPELGARQGNGETSPAPPREGSPHGEEGGCDPQRSRAPPFSAPKRPQQRGASPATPRTQPRPAAGLLPPPAPSPQSALLLAVFYPRKNKRLPPFPSHAGGVGGGRPR